jgi:hypothetical protein
LVLAVVIPFSRPAYTWLRRISANKQLNISDDLAHPESSADPQVLLAEADRLYWLNNGPKAAALYAKAESLFASRGDARNELYAKIGHLRSEAETMSFVELSRFLNDQLQNPIMRNDPRLRLWCLAAKGYTDIEIDYRAEKLDWLEAQQIAKSLGEDRWVTRASGELGIIAFLEGNTGQGAKLLGTDRSFEEFCKKHGDRINMTLIDPATAKWLVSEYGVSQSATNGMTVSRVQKHALVIRACHCGRKIAGTAYFRHVRTCQSVAAASAQSPNQGSRANSRSRWSARAFLF